MFTFFKSNNPSVVAFNLILIVLFRVGFLLHPADVSYLYRHTEPASQWLFSSSHIDILWLTIAGGVLCFIESLLVNKIVNSHKVTTRKNYVGGLLFVLFSALVPEAMVLSPALIATLFLLLVINRLFNLGRPEKLLGDIFDLGFLSALAMCFYFPAVYFLLFVLIGFFVMRTTSIQGLMLIITGFVAVLVVVFTIYFWEDRLPTLLLDMVNSKNRIPLSSLYLSHWQQGIIAWLGVTALFVLTMMPGLLFAAVIQTRKYITILVVGGLISLVATIFDFNFNLSHLLFLAVSLSILYTVFFVETKIRWIPQFLFYLLILTAIAVAYIPLFITV